MPRRAVRRGHGLRPYGTWLRGLLDRGYRFPHPVITSARPPLCARWSSQACPVVPPRASRRLLGASVARRAIVFDEHDVGFSERRSQPGLATPDVDASEESGLG